MQRDLSGPDPCQQHPTSGESVVRLPNRFGEVPTRLQGSETTVVGDVEVPEPDKVDTNSLLK